MKKFLLNIIIFFISASCGSNIYEPIETHDPATKATLLIEQGKTNNAIKLLFKQLGSTYQNYIENITLVSNEDLVKRELTTEVERIINIDGKTNAPNLISILSSAYSQKAQIDILRLSIDLANNKLKEKNNNISNNNLMVQIIPLLPEPSDFISLNLKISHLILNSISGPYITKHDLFKKSIILTSQTALLVKELDKDGDGTVSPFEAVNLNSTNANTLYNSLAKIAEISTELSQLDPSSKMGETVEQVAKIKETIDSTEGDTLEAKIQNYLSKDASQ